MLLARSFQTSSAIRQQGFTLIEVMVVLTIIGLMLSMATLSTGGNEQKQETRQEALRFIALLDAYRNEAVFQNIDLGLAMDGKTTQLLKFVSIHSPSQIEGKTKEELKKLKDNPWDAYDGSLKDAVEFPEQISMSLALDDKDIDFSEFITDDEDYLPAIQFLSSDEYTPFKITMAHDFDETFSIIIEGDGFSRFEITTEYYED